MAQKKNLPVLSLFHEAEDYPKSIVDIEKQSRTAKKVLYGLQKNNREEIAPIVQKHASRRKRNKK